MTHPLANAECGVWGKAPTCSEPELLPEESEAERVRRADARP